MQFNVVFLVSYIVLQFWMAHLITLTTNPDCLQKASGLKMPIQEPNCGVGGVSGDGRGGMPLTIVMSSVAWYAVVSKCFEVCICSWKIGM